MGGSNGWLAEQAVAQELRKGGSGRQRKSRGWEGVEAVGKNS